MVFEPITQEQRKRFFEQGCGPCIPGYTGHCSTLKFRVGKRFGAHIEEIMKTSKANRYVTLQELLEKQILKDGRYRPTSGKEVLIPIVREKDIRRDWKNDSYLHKASPYILGYTGYIPGFNGRYGLSFKRAVEEGGKEWRETQNKLRAKRDALRAHIERTDPRNLLARARSDNVDVEIDHGHDRERMFFENHVSPEKPPIVGYTGHIPGAKGEVALSKRYAQAAKRGLELLHKERTERYNGTKDRNSVQKVLDVAYLDETGYTRA